MSHYILRIFSHFFIFFFFQAEDGIRDVAVTGVQTCALPIWMALTEEYAIEFAAMVAPYRIYWMEECLQPDDYDGFGRLHERIKSTLLATGEHEYTRYGFRLLLEHQAADIWQPDVTWCGGLSELRHIGALAAAYNIPVIPQDRKSVV